jgi:hypothetical protein
MSNGIETDYNATVRQLQNPDPIKDGKTWLRHKINSQTAIIDLMILEGKYSKRDIARELENKTDCKDPLRRIESHIDHLQNAEGVDAGRGNIPHSCKIKEISGKIMFTE